MAADQSSFQEVSLAGVTTSSPFIRYGDRAELGDGEARTYLEFDIHGRPIELGVVLTERAMEGLPAVGTGHHGGHEMPHTYLLDLPEQAGVPFRFVEFNAALAPPGVSPAQMAVPMMGVHWVDTTSPELQGVLGNPGGYRPFTRTFIHSSWDGQVIFWEPLITRAHILSKKEAKIRSCATSSSRSRPRSAISSRAGIPPRTGSCGTSTRASTGSRSRG